MGSPTVWIKAARGWTGIRADHLQTICAIQDPGQYEPGQGRNPTRPVDVAVSAGLVDQDGEQLLRVGTCQAAYADDSLQGLLTALADAAGTDDVGFVVVEGQSPGRTSVDGVKTPRPGPIRWQLHRDRWPIRPRPQAPTPRQPQALT